MNKFGNRTNKNTDASAQEDLVKRALQQAGRRSDIPPDIHTRIKENFRLELKASSSSFQVRPNYFSAALKAACLLVLIAGTYFTYPTFFSKEIPVATIDFVSGGLNGSDLDGDELIFVAQSPVRRGETLITSSESFAEIIYNGSSLRMNANSSVQLFEDHIQLNRGQIYLDSSRESQTEQPLVVMTSFAEIHDIGTQFLVTVSDEGLVTSVREGLISVDLGEDKYLAQPTESAYAKTISVSKTGEVSQLDINRTDEDWNWILKASSRFKIEGASIAEFLVWVSHEMHYEIQYDNRGTQLLASSTILHGPIEVLNPDQDVELILATAELQVDRSTDGVLAISRNPTQGQ